MKHYAPNGQEWTTDEPSSPVGRRGGVFFGVYSVKSIFSTIQAGRVHPLYSKGGDSGREEIC